METTSGVQQRESVTLLEEARGTSQAAGSHSSGPKMSFGSSVE
jgi:hypothetical protein